MGRMATKTGAFAVAAAIGLLVVSCRSGTEGAPNDTFTNESATASPAEPVEVAEGFLEAYGDFDAVGAIAYLADDADIQPLVESVGAPSLEGTLDEFRLLLSLLEAQGYKQILRPCEEGAGLAAETTLRCPFEFYSIRAYELKYGPFRGGSFTLTVRDGEIVRAGKTWGIEEFSPQVWEPFARWVSENHPEDFPVMYAGGGQGAQLTEESIRLWERRSREYVEVTASEALGIAERFMKARAAGDDRKAMSLLADDGVRVRLLNDNALYPFMPTDHLSRRELVLALEAERLYGVRYEATRCRRHPVWGSEGQAQILCFYRLDSRLRQIAGLPPKRKSFGIGVRNGRIDYLSFPWINISWGPNGFWPIEAGRFVRWLDAEHPDAVDVDNPGRGGGRLFRTGGQEWTLKLTRKSLDLLAGYLDEYERSVDG